MKTKGDAVSDIWEIPTSLISLPIKPLIMPLLKEIGQNRMNKFIAKEITREQFYTQGLMISYTVNFLNSLLVGFLIFIVMRIVNQYRGKR
jgi:large-conductance mechanosensitive channel